MAALIADLEGLDTIVFTAGIGENAPQIRARIVKGLEWMGARLDEKNNNANATQIHALNSTIDVYVVPTDEEKIIAESTFRLA